MKRNGFVEKLGKFGKRISGYRKSKGDPLEEYRFKQLFDHISSCVAVYEAVDEGNDFVIKDLNPAAERVERVAKNKAINRRVTEVFPGIIEFGLLKIFKRVWETGNPEKYPVKLYKDNRIFGWKENYVFKLPSGEVVSVYDDITEQKTIEEELRLFKEVIAQTSEGVVITNKSKVMYVNDAFAKMHGYSNKELIGQETLFFHGKEDIDILEKARETIKEKGFWSGETRHEKKDGTVFPVFVNVSRINDDKGKEIGVAGICRDISEQEKLVEEKRNMQKHFMEVQKMEAITNLCKGIVCDFNDIITSIKCTTDLIILDTDENSKVYGDLKEIRQMLASGSSMLNQLILFTGEQPKNPEILNLNTIVIDLVKMMKPSFGEHMAVITELEPKTNMIEVDRLNINQLLMNLLSNAKDVMPEGGKVFIRTENVLLTEKQVKGIPGARSGSFVCLTVDDTGIGMRKEGINHIFEPYYSTKKGRLGIGLPVVYGIVKQHNGWITVDSLPGRGTTFKIYLSACDADVKEKIQDIFSLEKFRGNKEKILLVDDDKSVRKMVKRILETNGYAVFEAGSAQETLFVLKAERGKFDLVLCDINLYEKDGISLINVLETENPGIKVLSVGYPQQKLTLSEMTGKGYVFLPKPFGLPDVLKAVKEALSGKDPT